MNLANIRKEHAANEADIESRLAVLAEMKKRCEDENRDPDRDERRKAQKILKEINQLEKRQAEIELLGGPSDPPDKASLDGTENYLNGGGGPASSPLYRDVHYGNSSRTLDKGGFKNGSEFLDVINSGRFDSRLQRDSQIENTPSLGGFSVPEAMTAQWLDDSLPNEIVRPLCQNWSMSSNTRNIPGWDGEDQSAGELFGGFKMEFLAETGTGTKQTGKMRLISLQAKKGAIFCDISSELEQDGLGFDAQLKSALTKSIGYGIDKYCITGSGAGVPQGVFSSPALITVAKEAGQSADSIVYENLVKMYARQLNKKRAVWLFNDDAVPQLMQISIAVGTGGSHVKLLNENDGKFTIFGRPVYFVPHMPTVGNALDCGFIDFGAYALGMRKEMAIDKSNIPGWTQDLVSYRILIRFDGQGVLSQAVAPENGATLSPFVGLAERS